MNLPECDVNMLRNGLLRKKRSGPISFGAGAGGLSFGAGAVSFASSIFFFTLSCFDSLMLHCLFMPSFLLFLLNYQLIRLVLGQPSTWPLPMFFPPLVLLLLSPASPCFILNCKIKIQILWIWFYKLFCKD